MVLQLARNPAHASMLSRVLDTHQDALLARDADGNSLLHIAAAAGAGDVCAELLQRGLSIDVLNHAGLRAGTQAIGSACAVLQPTAPSPSVPQSTVEDDENKQMCVANLPDDVVLCILRTLDGLRDALIMRAVSGRFRRLMDQVYSLIVGVAWSDCASTRIPRLCPCTRNHRIDVIHCDAGHDLGAPLLAALQARAHLLPRRFVA